MRRTRLRRLTPLDRGTVELVRSGPIKKRNQERHDRDWIRAFHSPAFVQFTHSRPCVCRGLGVAWGCDGWADVVSHDPTRGAGGTWKQSHPASNECHAQLHAGPKTFWETIRRTRVEANREHYYAFLAYGGKP